MREGRMKIPGYSSIEEVEKEFGVRIPPAVKKKL